MDGRDFRINTFASLYGESSYPLLARAWQQVKETGAVTAGAQPAAAPSPYSSFFWSLGPAEPQVAVNDDGPANILILQNRRDAATPLRGGQLIRAKFAHRSRLVTVDENQHGVYVYDDNPCALNIGTAWLVEGVLPPDTTCAAATRSGLNLDHGGEQRRAETLRKRPLGTVTTN